MANGGHPIAKRAMSETWRFAQAQLLFGAVLALAGVLWAQPWDNAKGKPWWTTVIGWSLPIVGPFVLVFVLVLIWHAMSAPYFILHEKVESLEDAIRTSAVGGVTSVRLVSPALSQLRNDAVSLCEDLHSFLDQQRQLEPEHPPNLQQNTPAWDEWSKARRAYLNTLESQYERRFAHRIQAMVQRMITHRCASQGDLTSFRKVRNEDQLADAVRDFCALAENVGAGISDAPTP